MSEKTECPFCHPLCTKGCPKMLCRSMFPKSQPVIMEETLKMCKSVEFKECERYIEGLSFQEERRKSHIGCPFLTNNLCGHPEVWRCDGGKIPFFLKGTLMGKTYEADIEVCKGDLWGECPNYMEGIALRKEVEKIHADRAVKNKQTY